MGKKKPSNKAPKIVSMTGFGRSSVRDDNVAIEVEIRSVNSRFLDAVLRLPKVYSAFEAGLREVLSEFVQRGRVEVYVSRTAVSAEACAVEVNEPLLQSYALAYERVFKGMELLNEEVRRMYLRDILSRSDVLAAGGDSASVESEQDLVIEAVKQALAKVRQAREVEGVKIGTDIISRAERLDTIRQEIQQLSEDVPLMLKKRLDERLDKLGSEIALDPERVAMEAAIVADKADITEELVRLSSHLKEFSVIMKSSPNGRKLEFMLQEIGREFNTIGSKSVTAEIPRLVVEAKSELEKLKEQIQNVE